ncbi:polyprenyl synthetase family protein [Actinocatenispora sera]|uniref:Geranylgeranyl pyrophosphate synthase n=1 Tax=Actinocatenispora sera TaxID=390989 RepID=A0A810L8N0_9ACTN|nr:polyprenyl synthetase family protein [Actinocatenispora sera]BCJ30952.1 geranylgeranyl pyrophosphate synthase [Actinocatenispora sera]
MPTVPATTSAALRARIEAALRDFLAAQRGRLTTIDPQLDDICAAVEAFVLGGGKRLRPTFAYWGYRGAGGADDGAAVTAFASLELLQACALMHDDVMDSSDTRRGEPAVHRRFATLHAERGWSGAAEGFGTAAAILLGDLCLGWSAEMYDGSGVPAPRLAAGREAYHLMRTEVMAGQYLDVLAQADVAHSSRDRAERVARYKSAKYTVERPLLLGGRLAGAGSATLAAYSAYGLPLGAAFQLRDDVLGVFGDPARTGKPAGDDLREGKRTYLVAAAYEATTPAGRAVLDARLGAADLDADGVAQLRALIVETGALADTERRIDQLTAAALGSLADAPIAPYPAGVLADLATAATARTR